MEGTFCCIYFLYLDLSCSSLIADYDTGSIMHYGGYSWSVQPPRRGTPGLPTIIDAKTKLPIKSQRDGITDEDLKKINILYQCNKKVRWGTWSEWSSCSSTCGENGYSTRMRKNLNGLDLDSSNEDGAVEQRSCNRVKCVAQWGQWSSWSKCSEACGPGFSKRERACDDLDQTRCEGEKLQLKKCMHKKCPPKSIWRNWSSWTACTKIDPNSNNLQGIRSRERTCPSTEQNACGLADETVENQFCEVAKDCQSEAAVWSKWSSWSACNKDCGGGFKIRDRICQKGGCKGASFDQMKCNEEACTNRPTWVEFSRCSATCGLGFKTMKYTDNTCIKDRHDNVVRANDGTVCFRNEQCDLPACPTLTEWSEWSSCIGYGFSQQGISKRTRRCNTESSCRNHVKETKTCSMPKDVCRTHCDPHPAEAFGFIKCNNKEEHGSTCGVRCPSGYTLEDKSRSMSKCRCDKGDCQWTQALAKCVPVAAKTTARPVVVATTKPTTQTQIQVETSAAASASSSNQISEQDVFANYGCNYRPFKFPKSQYGHALVCSTKNNQVYTANPLWKNNNKHKAEHGTSCQLVCGAGYKLKQDPRKQKSLVANCGCVKHRKGGVSCNWDNFNFSWCVKLPAGSSQKQVAAVASAPSAVAAPTTASPTTIITTTRNPYTVKTSSDKSDSSMGGCAKYIPKMMYGVFECMGNNCRTRCHNTDKIKSENSCECKTRFRRGKKRTSCTFSSKPTVCSKADTESPTSSTSSSGLYADFYEGSYIDEIDLNTYDETIYDPTEFSTNDSGLPTSCQNEDLLSAIKSTLSAGNQSYLADETNHFVSFSNQERTARLSLKCDEENNFRQRGPHDFHCKCTNSKGCFWAPGRSFEKIRCVDMSLRQL